MCIHSHDQRAQMIKSVLYAPICRHIFPKDLGRLFQTLRGKLAAASDLRQIYTACLFHCFLCLLIHSAFTDDGSYFKQFDEFAHVLIGENPGRESEQERILVYNIGIALHDIYFASKIYDKLSADGQTLDLNMTTDKFWV